MRASEHTRYLRRLAADTARERLRRAKQTVRDARAARRAARARANEACKQARAHLREWSASERLRVRLEIARLREELRLGLEERRARVRKCCGPDRAQARKEADELVAGTRAALAQLLDERRRERLWSREKSRRVHKSLFPGVDKGRSRAAAERRAESDHEVEVNLDPDQLLVWSKVKGRIKGTDRKSRTEAFLEWMGEHGAEVGRILEAEAVAAEKAAIREEAEARKEARAIPRANESKLRRYLATGRDLLGVAGIPLLSPLAAGAGVLARARKERKAAERSDVERRKLKLRSGAPLRPKTRPAPSAPQPPERQPWAPMPEGAPAFPSSARTMVPGSTIDFGLVDNKGRALGFWAGPIEHRPGFKNGPYFVRAYPTRAGKAYGASRAIDAKRPELLAAKLNKRMQAARARYAKQFKPAKAASVRPPASADQPFSPGGKAALLKRAHALGVAAHARGIRRSADDPELAALLQGEPALIQGWLAKRWQKAWDDAANPIAQEETARAVRLFATRALDLAQSPQVRRFHDDRAYIASVWDQARRHDLDPISLDDFKAQLIKAHRAGFLRLTRADLVGAMDPKLVERSETTYQGASFHFIALDEQPRARTSSRPPASMRPPPAEAPRRSSPPARASSRPPPRRSTRPPPPRASSRPKARKAEPWRIAELAKTWKLAALAKHVLEDAWYSPSVRRVGGLVLLADVYEAGKPWKEWKINPWREWPLDTWKEQVVSAHHAELLRLEYADEADAEPERYKRSAVTWKSGEASARPQTFHVLRLEGEPPPLPRRYAMASKQRTAEGSRADMAEAADARLRAGEEVHKFELSGLGRAPFKWAGVTENRTSSGQPGGSCDYCGMGIRYECWVNSADGRRFKVGMDCIQSAGDSGLRTRAEHWWRKHQDEQRKVKKQEKNLQAASTHAVLLAQLDEMATWGGYPATFSASLAKQIRRGKAPTTRQLELVAELRGERPDREPVPF